MTALIDARILRTAPLLAALVCASTGSASKPAPAAAPPAVLQSVIGCRTIADSTARLQCFDSATAKLETASSQGDIAVFDRAQVEKTRRSLFGFNLPSLDIFGHHSGDPQRDAQDNELKEVDGTIASVGHGFNGWVLTLQDGARWEQTDDTVLGLAPKPGKPVVIRRGVMGSYKMTINNGVAIKVRRVE